MRSFAFIVAFAISASASCPGLCSGNGRCGADDKCTCFRGYEGQDCSLRKCPQGRAWVDGSDANAHSYSVCSNKGTCDGATGTCNCVVGYEGSACQRSSCPNQCSGHGECRFVEELSNQTVGSWDSQKIQGCRCDPGWTGIDCSQRLCPLGDDPMTVAPTTEGETWAVSVTYNSFIGPATAAEIHLELASLEDGSTVSTRPIDTVAGTATTIDDVVLDSGLVKSILRSSVARDDYGFNYTFTLGAPLRLRNIRTRWEDDCNVAGCQPRRVTMAPAKIMTAGAASVVIPANVKAESAVCSNRGDCDTGSGDCACYEGFYGRACEHQTVLI